MTKIDKRTMDAIAVYMDDDKREQVHFEFAPCEPEEFLTKILRMY